MVFSLRSVEFAIFILFVLAVCGNAHRELQPQRLVKEKPSHRKRRRNPSHIILIEARTSLSVVLLLTDRSVFGARNIGQGSRSLATVQRPTIHREKEGNKNRADSCYTRDINTTICIARFFLKHCF